MRVSACRELRFRHVESRDCLQLDNHMIIGIPKEKAKGERRVAASPQSTTKLIKLGYEVLVESGAGAEASFPDHQYAEAGAQIVGSPTQIWADADLVIKVNAPLKKEIDLAQDQTRIVSFLWPAKNEKLLGALNKKSITSLAMDCVPRISRAQKLDALSSMANIAGYRAVIEAANEFGSFFTGQITAAGKVPPAKVLVIGAGVAGLSAIGTANSLGAVVRAFDTRLAVKDQVKSLGAEFLELEFEEAGEGEGGYAKVMSDEFIAAEMQLFAEQAKEVDIIVTTALIPGKPAPKLLSTELVQSMKPGSVIVDLAAENGGNCELTESGKKVVAHGVTIIGYTDLPSCLPTQSSNLYANNIVNLLTDMTPQKDGQLVVDVEDTVVRGALVTHEGQTMWPPPKTEAPSPQPQEAAASVVATTSSSESQTPPEDSAPVRIGKVALDAKSLWMLGAGLATLLILWIVGRNVPGESGFVSHLTVFVLSCFVGYQVIWNVNPALHTPLMSVTNAISGIIIVGGMLQMITPGFSLAAILAALAVMIAMINVAGGFFVTEKMLAMFRKQD